MLLRRSLLLTICMVFTYSIQAQRPESSKAPTKYTTYFNGITLNFPNYVQIATFGGWSIGAEYRRLLNSQGTLGATLSYTHLIWAGTLEAGKYYSTGQRANITANLLGPGFNYYPNGLNEFASLEIGVVGLIGTIRRSDSYQSGISYAYIGDSTEHAFFFTPQLHAALSILGKSHLLFSIYGDFGPMLAGSSKTPGNYGVIGMKIGRRY